VDVDAHRIRARAEWIQLKPRSIAVLAHLVEHAGEVCPRQDIMDAVWGAVDVSGEVLNHAVHELRVAFDDDSRDPRVIETIPRGGYRLIARVEQASTPRRRMPMPVLALIALLLAIGAVLLWMHRIGGDGQDPARLAVLPFENMAPDSSFDYFSDGLTEELITRLNEVNPQRLDVIARTSVMAYKGRRETLSDIADQLAVDYIVEGSVRRSADRIRITAQLIETDGQTHLWAGSFDRSIGDVLALQTRLAREIARQARVPLG
jgi:TolB-like protein